MDNKKLLEMKQERANLVTNIRSIMDAHEKVEMPAEKRGEMEKMETRFDEINKIMLAEEKQKERERSLGEAETKPDEVLPEKAEEVRKAYVSYLKNGTSSAMDQYRALQQDNPTQAGYLVAPEQFAAQIIEDKNNLSFMRQMSNVLPPLQKAASLGFPKRTARMSTFAWGTEIQAPTADTALAFGKREFIAKPATGGILVSKTLVRNAAISIEQYIRKEMAFNQTIHEEQAFLTGTGAGQPLGVFTASADGISTSRDVSTGNTATEIKFDGLYEAKYSIKQQYQQGLNWLFSRTGVKQIAKLKDSDGQYIWQQSVVLSVPDMLMGYPVKMSEYAPSTFTTGLYVGLLGNFKEGYWITDSLTMEIQALMELYALTNQVFYIGRSEVDAMPVLEEPFARIKLG
jgi:HK97 family phage major capsid protein